MTTQFVRSTQKQIYFCALILLGSLGFAGSALAQIVDCGTVSAGANATITASCSGLVLDGAGNVVVSSGVTLDNSLASPAVDVIGSSNSFQNNGVINSAQFGLIIEPSVNLQTLSNTSTATISVNAGAPQAGGIALLGNVSTINNSGQISAINFVDGVVGGIGSSFAGVLGTLNNSDSGTISAEGSGSTGLTSLTGGVINGGVMGTINNTGSAKIMGVDSGTVDVAGIMSVGTFLFSTQGRIGAINNSGSAEISGTSKGPGDAFGILNEEDIIEVIANSGMARITGTSSDAGAAYGIGNSGTTNLISNTELASISAVASGTGQAIGLGIYSGGILGSVTNSGMIGANSISGDALGISNFDGTLNTINNTGTVTATSVSGGAYGIENTGTFGTLNNTSSATISAITTGTGLAQGIFNAVGGTITAINNSGSASISATTGAAGGDAYGINNHGTIGEINNSGSATISATSSSVIRGVDAIGIVTNMGAVITTLNNDSTSTISASGTGSAYAIRMFSGTIGTINNSGTINASSSARSASAIQVRSSGYISSFNNSGDISANSGGVGFGAYAIDNGVGGTIDTLTNTGALYGIATGLGSVSFGISNGGTITTLNNSQGGNGSSPSTTALTYYGNLPTNYNLIINSATHYGQLSVTSPVGAITNFGIYGTPFITSRTYSSVLSGTARPTNTYSGSYDNMTWSLVANGIDTYDLTFTGVSLMGTQQSLVNTANALAPVYALQNAVLVNSFTYDCTLFDVNNICISVGGRNTQVSAANGLNNTSALLIAAYRPHPNYRIGAYADQNLSVNNAGSTVNLTNSTPLIGIFAAWTQNQAGTGAEVRVSAAYGQKDATINRQVVGLSEPGSGSSTLNSQGAQITAKYGFAVTDKAIVSPYVGVRYTQSNMGGYTEGASSSVTSPLTYSALNTNATTALAGLGVSYKIIPTVTTFASAGVETDTNTSNGTYSATGINGLTPVNFNPNPVRTRPTATLGAYFDIAKNQRFGVTGIYRQEAYQAVSSTTVMATYTIGL